MIIVLILVTCKSSTGCEFDQRLAAIFVTVQLSRSWYTHSWFGSSAKRLDDGTGSSEKSSKICTLHDVASLITRWGMALLISKNAPSLIDTSVSPPLPLIITNRKPSEFSMFRKANIKRKSDSDAKFHYQRAESSQPLLGTTTGTCIRWPFCTQPPWSACFRILDFGFMQANWRRSMCFIGFAKPKWSLRISFSTGANISWYLSKKGNLKTRLPAKSENISSTLSTPGLNWSMLLLRPWNLAFPTWL